MSFESVMLSYHLILCCSLLLLPSIFPSIRVFSLSCSLLGTLLVAQQVKNLPAMQETPFQFLSQEDWLKKE